MRLLPNLLLVLSTLALSLPVAAQSPAKPAGNGAEGALTAHPKATELLARIDELIRFGSDGSSTFYMEEEQQGRRLAREGKAYNRAAEDQFVLFIEKPKTEQGGGYLKVGNNLFAYDAKLGRWERRTERDRLAGTNLRRSDLAERNYSREYVAVDLSTVEVQGAKLQKLTLEARPGVEVAFPKLVLWVGDDLAIRKIEEFGDSGKLLRTALHTKHARLQSKGKGGPVLVAREIRLLDEVEKDRKSTVILKALDLGPVESSIFTKGYFESKSR